MPVIRDKLNELSRWAREPSWLAFVWCGLTAGISLLEAPVKFSAPTITREIALDVGRVVFTALNRVELVLLVLLLILVRVSDRSRYLWAHVGILALIMVAQSAWLLPELSARSQMIVSGVEPGPSIAHAGYAVTELLKLVTLLSLGFRSMSLAAESRGRTAI